MALVLDVRIGDVVDVANSWIKVQSIDGRSRATLACSDGRKLAICASWLTRLTPDVLVGLGPDPTYSQLRLVFEAPRHAPIIRRHP
jgi:hypothetical protein